MKILIPIDFSDDSVKALEFVLGLRMGKKTDFVLVHIIEVVYDFASQGAIGLETIHHDAVAMMNELVKKYANQHFKFEKIIKEGTASITIARLADEENADLIVMGTTGASGVKKILIGTTTVNIVKESNIPVLVIPKQANLAMIKNLTLGLEFSEHEKPLILKAYSIGKELGLELEFLHVQNTTSFKDELAVLGLQAYIQQTLEVQNPKIHSVKAENPIVGLDSFLGENGETLLVMCHQHKDFWKQIMKGSNTINMAYHIKVPLLVLK